uniref:cytosolic phospholipase A2-like n=1 Tax=Styela clava TaxID=7725 RepID=UPI0019393082|nr:cytosolic phospholipase A2-like [Styela clava]
MDADIAKWSEIDRKWNNSFADIPVRSTKPIVIKVKILAGIGINRNSIFDYVTYPHPRIEVECDWARGTKKFQTSEKNETNNPIWDETFRIVLSDGYDETSNGIMKFRLLDKGWIYSTTLAETDFDPDSLEIGSNFEGNISFGKMGTIRVKITKRQKTHLRLSHCLCDGEINFRKNRIHRAMKGMQRLLGNDGAPRNLLEAPIISVVGSGGGIRAMTGMCGVMEALLETGILDCLMYAVGTSGSSWYLTSSYARNALDKNRQSDYHSWLRNSLTTSPFVELVKPWNILKGRQVYKAKTSVGQPFTFIDYYGIVTAIKAMGEEYANVKLSDVRKYLDEANVPLPLLNSSQVYEDRLVQQYYADCSFTPYECEIPHYGVNVDMQRLNSQFHSGVMEKNLPEPDLQFLLGTLGSVFGVSLDRIKQALDEDDETDSEMTEHDRDHQEEQKSAWLNNLPGFLGRNGVIQRTGKVLNMVRGFSDMKRFRINPRIKSAGEEEFDGFDEQRSDLDLVDGGILCNVAVDAILRPQRRNDILIIIDFTGYDADVSFKTLTTSISLAKEGGYKFPPVDLKKIRKEGVKQFYIFEDENDPECPIVFWFLMTTKKFSQLSDYTPKNKEVLKDLPPGERFNDFSIYKSDTYDTFDLTYTNLEFDRLRELMNFNISSNAEIIKQKIREKISQKRKLGHQNMIEN